ncbi:hypothetical protein ACWCY6_16980 [Streptomyces sp. 900105755]
MAFALTGAKADERETLLDLLAAEPDLLRRHPGQTLIGDKNYFARAFEKASGRSSSRSTRRSRGSSTSNSTADVTRRRHRTRHATRTRADRRGLAQRRHWTNRPTLTDRLRSLTPWNRSSRWLARLRAAE